MQAFTWFNSLFGYIIFQTQSAKEDFKVSTSKNVKNGWKEEPFLAHTIQGFSFARLGLKAWLVAVAQRSFVFSHALHFYLLAKLFSFYLLRSFVMIKC